MVAGAVCQNVLKFVPFGRNAMVELNTSKTFRKLDTIGMARRGFRAVRVVVHVRVRVLDPGLQTPGHAPLRAQIFWIIGAGHGIVIEHASIKYGRRRRVLWQSRP